MPADFATQSSCPQSEAGPVPRHVALVPDGNGRWATGRGLPRSAGHRAGVEAVQRAVAAALGHGIAVLTVHALSSENFRRPPDEVRSILGCVAHFLDAETPRACREGVRVTVIGRRDRLPDDILAAVVRAERATSAGRRLHLRIAVDYSSRGALAAAARDDARTRDDFAAALGADGPDGVPVPDVDLLVRTGGEMRLGDFLLWECAWAELVFLRTPWPDFGPVDFRAALAEFGRRDRRFGALPAVPGAAR